MTDRSIVAWLLVLGVAACSEASITLGGPLDLQLMSNSPATLSQDLIVEYDIVGRSLLGMVVDWGDMQTDSVFFSGAQTAGGSVNHRYSSSGSFTVSARVEDSLEGSTTGTLGITILP